MTFLLTNGTTTVVAKAPFKKQKKVTFMQSSPSIMLLPKMSEIPDLERFLNHLRLQMLMQEKIFQMMILF